MGSDAISTRHAGTLIIADDLLTQCNLISWFTHGHNFALFEGNCIVRYCSIEGQIQLHALFRGSVVSRQYIVRLSIWAILTAFIHALYALALIVDVNGSFAEAFQGGSWQSAVFQILMITIIVFTAVVSVGVLWASQLMPRSIIVGACAGCASIATILASWAAYSAVENNPQDIYWDTAFGRPHLVEIFNVFYPSFLFTFLGSAFLVFLLLTVNYLLEAKRIGKL